MHIRIMLEFFENYKCPGIAFFSKASDVFLMSSQSLKTTGLYDDFFTFI